MDETGGVNLGVHSFSFTRLGGWVRRYPGRVPAGPAPDRYAGRAHTSRTGWPGRNWASESVSASMTTPMTG